MMSLLFLESSGEFYGRRPYTTRAPSYLKPCLQGRHILKYIFIIQQRYVSYKLRYTCLIFGRLSQGNL